jgi:hypothetical protein
MSRVDIQGKRDGDEEFMPCWIGWRRSELPRRACLGKRAYYEDV